MQALLLILGFFNIQVSRLLPKLFETLVRIECITEIQNPTTESVALSNTQFGQRGTIRKAHDLYSWVVVLKRISGDDMDRAKLAINKWNNDYNTRDFKITGNKKLAITYMLSAPTEGLEVLLAQVSAMGTDMAVTNEESMAEKRIYPGGVSVSSSFPTGRST